MSFAVTHKSHGHSVHHRPGRLVKEGDDFRNLLAEIDENMKDEVRALTADEDIAEFEQQLEERREGHGLAVDGGDRLLGEGIAEGEGRYRRRGRGLLLAARGRRGGRRSGVIPPVTTA